MSKDTGKHQPGVVKSARRREELRRAIPKPAIDLKGLFLRRESVNALFIFLAFWLVAGTIALTSRATLRLVPGRVMTETRLNRVDFSVEDTTATEELRAAAREGAPHVFVPNRDYLTTLKEELLRVPLAVENIATIEEVTQELRNRFELDQSRLDVLKRYVADGAVDQQWIAWVQNVVEDGLLRSPTLSDDQYQVELVRVRSPIFRMPEQEFQSRNILGVTQGDPTLHRERLDRIFIRATVPLDVRPIMASRLQHDPKPVYIIDQRASDGVAAAAAAAVAPRIISHEAGASIYRRGDVLTAEQIALAQREQAEFVKQQTTRDKVTRVTATYGIVAVLAMFMAGYLFRFYPRVVRNPWRVTAIAALILLMLFLAVGISTRLPDFAAPAAMATTLFAGLVLVIAYDQRLGTMITGLACALVAFAIDESLGFFLVLAAACWGAIAALRQVRHRNAILRAGAIAASIGAVASLLVGVLEVPLQLQGEHIPGASVQVISTAGVSFVSCLMTAFILLGILPSVERLFDMTTGMTLVELRDPRMPLLQQLQERAPGTYNHSISVANIAEAAAETIGADGLLTYVGALYHDVGKMNKPDYFVENQSEGSNKHDKLSPAMSLLVIVGHVKDGVELAREYNLPRSLLHFIASHHGTTLVEYFYHAAKAKAEAGGEHEKVQEIEYRYPGPKPRTREAAILMISDACESAARAVQDPSPASLEHLVRKLSRKRLDDGQFDECDLTLRELTLVEDSIVKSLIALHHSRISYPSKGSGDKQRKEHTVELPATRVIERRTSA